MSRTTRTLLAGLAILALVGAGHVAGLYAGSHAHRLIAPLNTLLIVCWLIAGACLAYRMGGTRFGIVVCLLVYFAGLVAFDPTHAVDGPGGAAGLPHYEPLTA